MLVLAFEVIAFFLVILGIVPRDIVPYLVILLSLYLILSPLEAGVLFFAASVPLFLAIPITSNFDNFNSWRIFSAILFLKWFYVHGPKSIRYSFSQWKTLHSFLWSSATAKSIIAILILAVISICVAGDKLTALKRVIYFINLSLIGFPITFLLKDKDYIKRLIGYLSIPIIIVTVVGFIQILSTYFIDIYQFMKLWGENIQCNQFGQQWCNIAVQVGNTWFAYYGDQLSLRVFSLFPDSHSMPIYLLLGLPAIFALSMRNMNLNDVYLKLKSTRTKLFIAWIPLIFIIMILTGTRGIWAAGLGTVFLILGLLIYMRVKREPKIKYFGFISSYVVIFFMLFAVAYPIFISPQFLMSKGDLGMFGNRIRSIIDFGETSNAQRIEIWKKTLVSIGQHPLLGVGIGNYPIVLSQDIKLSKAGSSAHNLYLHMAAEMGILSLVFTIVFLISIFVRIYKNFTRETDTLLATYYGTALFFIPWVFAYLMTDVAIFDERAFLMFVITLALLINRGD